MGTARILGSFTEADLARIAEAVARAEATTSGEIVTYIVRQCEDYREAPWKGALVGAILAGLVLGVTDWWIGTWGGPPALLWSGGVLVGAALGYAVTDRIEAVRRWAVPREARIARVQERAEAAFLEEEVFATRSRTGILLFLALFERRAVVLGDEGIHAALDPNQWTEAVGTIVDGMRRGAPTDAVVEAVDRCGALLRTPGLAPAAPDPNELDDAPRLRDR